MATKTTKKVTLQKRVESLKSGVSELHDEVLTTADKMVEVSLKSGAKWQKLMSRLIDKGTDLMEKQQDITFNTLEEVKSQYLAGNKRFKQLLGLDQTKAKKAAKLQKESRAASRKVTSKVSKTTKQLTASKKAAPTKDNLKELKGIGPKVETLLNKAGIRSFDELANATAKDLQAVLQQAGPRYQSMNPTTWKELAQEALTKRNN